MKKIKTITLRLDDDLHKKLKIHAVQKNESMQDILIRLIEEELSKEQENEEKE